jgi:flagellar biogenesis protein FliO
MSNGPSTIELLVRLVFSLGLIVGVLFLAAKFARKNGGALKLPGFGKKDTSIKVVERHSLTKTASIAVVQIGNQTMIVGVTEHGITRLADGPTIDLSEVDETSDQTARDRMAIEDEAMLDMAGADLATVLALRTDPAAATARSAAQAGTLHHPPATTAGSISNPEAKRTLPLGTATATLAAPARPPRMSFVEALRELTVRKA